MLEAGREENQDDIRTYLSRELNASNAAIEAILDKSEGRFLSVNMLRQEIEEGRFSLAEVNAFPRGLGGIYHAFFQRYFPDIEEYRQRWRPLIETVCGARQPLPLQEAARLFPAFYHPNEIATGLGSLFPDAGGGLRPFHQSVRDWVTEADRAGSYVVRVEAGHKRLADEGWQQYESEGRMLPYYVSHLPADLEACGRMRCRQQRAFLVFRPMRDPPTLHLDRASSLSQSHCPGQFPIRTFHYCRLPGNSRPSE